MILSQIKHCCIMTKTKVGAPGTKRSTHNLSVPFFTTTDLFKIQPTFCREVFKGDRFDIRMLQINRVDALPVSSFVEIDNKHHWYFVKAKQIWKPFEAFLSKAPYANPFAVPATGATYSVNINGINVVPQETPYFTGFELFSFFAGSIGVLNPSQASSQGTDVALSTYRWAENESDEVVSHVYELNETNLKKAQAMFDNHECDFIYIGDKQDLPYLHQDSSFTTTTNLIVCLKLNSVGRYIYSIFYSLGYRIRQVYGHWSSSLNSLVTSNLSGLDAVYNSSAQVVSVKQTALPLMAYLSIMVNYYTPTKFRDYSFVNSLAYYPAGTWSHEYNVLNNPQQLMRINSQWARFRQLVVNTMLSLYYGSDYFTDSLVTPLESVPGRTPLADPLSDNARYGQNAVVTSVQSPAVISQNSTSNLATVNEYLLAALKAVTTKAQIRALTKNNLIGSMLQQFGIKPESEDMKPYLLSSHHDQIVVEPEVTTADTFGLATDASGKPLGTPAGYKAGTGTGRADLHDKFDFDDYGFLICVNSVTPDISMSDGLNREMLHVEAEDFFDPAYVNLGYQAIMGAELTMRPDNRESDFSDPSTLFGPHIIFGFQNKYAEYGYPKYSMGGDFCIRSFNRDLAGFHFNRIVDGEKAVDLFNTKSFAMAKKATVTRDNMSKFISQYDRIFDVASPDYDHIQQWTYFKILASRSIPANGEFVIGDDNKNVVDGAGVTDNVNA